MVVVEAFVYYFEDLLQEEFGPQFCGFLDFHLLGVGLPAKYDVDKSLLQHFHEEDVAHVDVDDARLEDLCEGQVVDKPSGKGRLAHSSHPIQDDCTLSFKELDYLSHLRVSIDEVLVLRWQNKQLVLFSFLYHVSFDEGGHHIAKNRVWLMGRWCLAQLKSLGAVQNDELFTFSLVGRIIKNVFVEHILLGTFKGSTDVITLEDL